MGWWLACLAAAGVIFWWVKLGGARKALARPLPVASPVPAPPSETPRVSAAAKARTAKDPARWIAPGEAVTIGDLTLASGMIYVGGAASTAMHGDPDNCVIDPRLPLGDDVDASGSALPYWPSYGGIPPRERRTYLAWLAGGRCDPEIGIGYVFLFFYGLERRSFIEGVRQDHPALADEVRRLRAIYGRHAVFSRHAGRFLDVLGLLDASGARPALSPEPAPGYDMALPVRRWLGGRLARGEALAADDALLWLLALPDTRLRAPAHQCFDEFVALWTLRFNARYPAGLRVPTPPTSLKLAYSAASGAFIGEMEVLVDGAPVPDIAAIGAPPDGLRALAEDCCDALEPYARLVARNPAARDGAEALLLLPPELADPDRNARFGAMRDRLGAVLDGHKVAELGVAELFGLLALPVPDPGALASPSLSQVRALLDRLDIGFEPDSRYGARALRGEGRILLFEAQSGAPAEWEKPAYRAARCMSEMLVLAATSGTPAAKAEYAAISAELRRLPGLETVERMRLLVHLGFLFADAPHRAAVRDKLLSLPEEPRARLARAVSGTLRSDGEESPAGAGLIARMHALLNLPVGSDPSREPFSTDHDPQLPDLRQQEVMDALSLLDGLFAEETPPPASFCAPDPAGEGGPSFDGLDRRHGRLLAALLAAGSMGRSDFDELARGLRLLPDGACEAINEWAYATLGEAAIDGEDPICVRDRMCPRLNIPGHAA